MVSGLWEMYVRSFLFKSVKAEDIIVDVGAKIGIYAIPLSKKGKKVIAFEPNPICCAMLRSSAGLNKINNLAIFENAVSETKKIIRYKLAEVPMNSSITDSVTDNVIEINGIDLYSILADEEKLDWLLIDVEGYEVNVLRGASKILQKYSPKLIIEIIVENLSEAKEFLSQHGYRLHHLGTIYYYAIKSDHTAMAS